MRGSRLEVLNMFSGNKTASILVIVIGVGLLAASLLADVTGLGDNPGFGPQQTMGTITGAVIACIGLFLTMKAK